MKEAMPSLLVERGRVLAALRARLVALGPREVLRRGYAIATAADGRTVTDSSAVSVGERLKLKLHKGELATKVKEIIDEES